MHPCVRVCARARTHALPLWETSVFFIHLLIFQAYTIQISLPGTHLSPLVLSPLGIKSMALLYLLPSPCGFVRLLRGF